MGFKIFVYLSVDTILYTGSGKGGFVKGNTFVTLHPDEGGTRIEYHGDVTIGGTIARIGQRLIDAAAGMLLNQGFKALKKKIEEHKSQQ